MSFYISEPSSAPPRTSCLHLLDFLALLSPLLRPKAASTSAVQAILYGYLLHDALAQAFRSKAIGSGRPEAPRYRLSTLGQGLIRRSEMKSANDMSTNKRTTKALPAGRRDAEQTSAATSRGSKIHPSSHDYGVSHDRSSIGLSRHQLVEAVADLTACRENNVFEAGFICTLLELTKATSITLWRLIEHDNITMLHRILHVDATNVCRRNITRDSQCSIFVPIEERPLLHSCHERNRRQTELLDDGHGHHYVFPVRVGQDTNLLVEMRKRAALGPVQQKLISGMLRILSNHASIIRYSELDELTKLLNRKSFDHIFNHCISHIITGTAQPSKNSRSTLSRNGDTLGSYLTVMDIDFFKRVNDRFGHPYGDEVLVLFARLMKDNFRESDYMFRFGGEEFVVILRDITKEAAYNILERFRVAVKSFSFPRVGKLTVSIGYTSIIYGEPGPAAYGRADEALYAAKNNGRDQTLSYEALVENGIIHVNNKTECVVEFF